MRVPGEEEAAYARARVLVSVAGAGLAGVSSYLLYVLAGPLGKESVKRLGHGSICQFRLWVNGSLTGPASESLGHLGLYVSGRSVPSAGQWVRGRE